MQDRKLLSNYMRYSYTISYMNKYKNILKTLYHNNCNSFNENK